MLRYYLYRTFRRINKNIDSELHPMRNIQELKDKAIETGREHWTYSACKCGCNGTFFWVQDEQNYIRYKGFSKTLGEFAELETSWDALQRNYNNDDPKIYERHEREWGFINDYNS